MESNGKAESAEQIIIQLDKLIKNVYSHIPSGLNAEEKSKKIFLYKGLPGYVSLIIKNYKNYDNEVKQGNIAELDNESIATLMEALLAASTDRKDIQESYDFANSFFGNSWKTLKTTQITILPSLNIHEKITGPNLHEFFNYRASLVDARGSLKINWD